MEHQDEKKAEERKDTGELGLEVVDQLSQSAGKCGNGLFCCSEE